MKVLLIDENFDESLLPESLKELYRIYIDSREKQSAFQKFKHLKIKNLELYKEKCQQLANSVRFITFHKMKVSFEVRVTVQNYSIKGKSKRVQIGTFVDFDDAVESLKLYLQERLNIECGGC